MKNAIFIFSILLLSLTSCGSDDSPVPPAASPSFTLDNNNYSLLTFQGITEIKTSNVFTINNVNYNRSTLSIIGLNGFTQTATVSFDLYYKEGMSVAGTYTIYDDDDSSSNFDDYISPLDRACMGWTSAGVIFNNSASDPINSNNPTGTVTVIANSATNYTIQYTGNFRIYDDNFAVVRNVPCAVAITGNVEIH